MQDNQRRSPRGRLLLSAVAGALATLFLDPASGRRRRAQLRQRAPAFFRRRGREAARFARMAMAELHAVRRKAMHLREEPKDFNDPTLAAKVETVLFRDPDVPKGQINVNVQEGVVQLRGEVPRPELINELVDKARAVQGVRDVENLLHLPGTPAPTHA